METKAWTSVCAFWLERVGGKIGQERHEVAEEDVNGEEAEARSMGNMKNINRGSECTLLIMEKMVQQEAQTFLLLFDLRNH